MIANQKYRMTHQRKIILKEVKMVVSHPTADDVYDRVRRQLPRISLGTVYRNLDILSECGLIQKINPGYSQMRFDGNTEDHYHMRCINCGKVEDALIEPIDNLEAELRKLSDFNIIGHRLEFIGLCPECEKDQKPINKKSPVDG